MYERSAIVLEKYLNKKFGFDQKMNLKENYTSYCNIVKECKEYQEIVIEEENLIEKFDEVAKQIQNIQTKQSKLFESNLKMEEMRNQLFSDLGERPEILESKLEKVQDKIAENNVELVKLGEEFVKALAIFSERQKDRNKCARKKRVAEANHISYVKDEKEFFEQIDTKYIKSMKDFLENDTEEVKEELSQIMMKNGKNEKVAFHKEVIQKAISTRLEVAKKEIECYLTVYERSKKLLAEIDNEELKLTRYEKTSKDMSVKLAFLEAEKDYIVGFLDNERLTAINGPKQHKKVMDEACEGFDSDILQIKNLYELLLREIAGKSTKKAYKELYNKTYLKEIEQKEKNFEQELNHIKIHMGTVINSNYWRIEGIKNIYNVFQKEITEKFEKDLSEYQIEEPEEVEVYEDEIEEETEKYDKLGEVLIDSGKEGNEIEDDDDIDLTEFDFGEDDDDDDFDFDLDDDEEDDEELDFYDEDEEEFEENEDDDYFEEDDEDKEVEEDFFEDDEDEEDVIIEESKKKSSKKIKVYKQVRGKKIAEIIKGNKKKNKKESKKKEPKRGKRKQIIEVDELDEFGELPKAMKTLKQNEEELIVTKKPKKKKNKEQKQEDKGMFNKLFKK